MALLELPRSDWAGWLDERCQEQLGQARTAVERIRGHAGAPADEVLDTWNDVQIGLSNAFAVTSLVANVHPDPGVRAQAEQAQQDAHRLLTELSLDRGLYDVLVSVEGNDFDAAARRMLDRSLRDFRRAGVDRDAATRDRLRALSERQTELEQTFARNIREGVRRLRVEPDRLAGLPEDFVAGHPVCDDGLVELTTEYPDYTPVMTFAADRSLRRELLAAFLDRAWPDNDAVLGELLQLRREYAELLGHPDWPAYDAEVKMIGSANAIPAFVDRITTLSSEAAQRDVAVLLERLRRDVPDATAVGVADKGYYAELIRKERFAVDAQEVRRFFDFDTVRRGLLQVTGRLFGVDYDEVPDAPTWHDDVTTYNVQRDGERIGRIHLDLHPREGKYSHAAQFDLVSGVRGRQLPEGVLVCNFPTGLMEHDQVVTLFHEFGHLLHHVLGGDQRWIRFSGVATEWDFVEAPSQLLEEWAWDPAVLATFANDEAGEPIGAELVARMREADEFGKGYLARTQMFYAAVSYVLHRDVPADLTATVAALQERYDLFEPLPGTHFHASFGHLGGYTSAYYTYMWSLVIAKDLFSAFDPDDLFAADVAARYRDCILVPGGSRDAAELVKEFLGRPTTAAAFEVWLAR